MVLGERQPSRNEVREAWLRAKRNRSGSLHTYTAYRHDIGKFFDWADEHGIPVFEAFGPDIEAYVESLLRAPDGKRLRENSSAARMLTSVASFYAYAVRNTNGAVVNPVTLVDRPDVDTKSRTLALSKAELDSLRRAARELSTRDYAMVQLLAGTAIRVSELCGADVSDISTDSGYDILRVTRKGGKPGKVRLPPATLEALRAYTQNRDGALFLMKNGERMTRRMVDYRLGVVAKAAHIGKRVSPHCLRHTAATLALDAKVPLRDLQVQMGHSRPDTTARYDQARRELNNAAADAMALMVSDEPEDNAMRGVL